MLELYWGCLIIGGVFALLTVLFGDFLGGPFDGFFHVFPLHIEWLQPTVIIGGITIFGGMGLMLTGYTELASGLVILFSLLTAILFCIFIYFLYIKPMRNCENSAGFFIRDLIGKTGEVTVPIPVNGCGEILIKIGAGNTNQIAVNQDNADLAVGTRVIVTDVRENVLYVSNYTEDNEGGVL